jgi:DNA-directed RNA polymerase specialized sigma24 family protein
VAQDRPARIRPLSGNVLDGAAAPAETLPDAELLDRLEAALAALPAPERAAAVVAFGLDEGPDGVAETLGLSGEDADALSRSALQLLRGALGEVELDSREVAARLPRRGRHGLPPGD